MKRDFALPFQGLHQAAFVERPNRFLLVCQSTELGRIEVFLPNPGRMWELLFPGVAIYFIEASRTALPGRKTRYTAIAVERDGAPVFLDTHVNNHVARFLVEHGRVPGLENAEVVRTEAPVGHSRFDFLLRDKGRERYLEVKSCTLFGNGVAMFPDAVTERGRRHLLELAALSDAGTPTAVLFIVHSPAPRWFMPDYHTDIAFSRTLLDVRERVRILPVSVEWRSDLSLGDTTRLLEIPWDYIGREAQDTGSYLLVLRLARRCTIQAGQTGLLAFGAGYYVYAGSAMSNIDARIARHLRMAKRMHWHIDYLRKEAAECIALPIRTSERIECELAKALSQALAAGPKGFGSSDCSCETHLFYSIHHPLHLPAFHEVLQRFRMRPPRG